MNNRALIGLSAAAMSALVATAVGCGEPQQKTYTPAEEPAATVEAPATTEAETTETEAAEPEAAEADKAEETAEPAADEKAEPAAEDAKADEKAAPAAEETKADEKAAPAAEQAAPAEETKADEKKADDKAAKDDKAADAKDAKADDKADAAAALTDGEYTAEGKGIGGKVPVTVTVKDGKIAEVTVGENSETQGIGSKAIEQLPAKIVEAGGTEGVDAVSGASVTSKAIFTAVDEALEQAKGGAAAEQAAPAEDAKADEKKADDKAAKDDKAADAKYAKADEKKADEKAAPAAEQAAPAEDAKDAKADDKADAAAALTDGEYTAEGKGIGGKVPVTVTVKDGKIAEVTVGENSETQGIGSKAIEQLPAKIVEAGGTEGVDAVSGASVTSKAIFTAVDEALEQAKGGAAAEQAAPAEDAKADEKKADDKAAKDDKAADAKADEKKADDKDAKADEKKADEKAAKDDKAADAKDAKADEKKADEKAAKDDKAADAKDDKAADAEDAKADDKADAAAALTDGEYTAEGKGIGGKVPVTVTVKDGKIAEVKVGENSETQGIGSKAIEQLPAKIVEAGGTEGVDAVSGASVTSKAIFTAVDEALEQAKGGAAAEQAAPAEDAKADEKKADDKAAKDDKAADAKDAKADEKKADEKAAPAAEQAAPAEETKADEKKADDKAAKDDKAADAKDAKADDKADAAAALTDGEYTAEGKGIGGKVPVTVTVKDGKIAEVTVGENSETQGIGSKAIEQLPAKIVEAGGTEGVDAVSGASVTSKAIFTAVDEALEQAKGGAAAEQAAPAEDAKADEKKADDKAAKDDKAADAEETKADEKKADEKAAPAAEQAAPAEETKADEKKADEKAAKDDKAADAKDDKAADAEDAKADDKADAAAALTDGEYTAEGKGIGGKVPVTVTVKDGKIAEVKVGENSETQGIGSKAIEQLPAAIVEAGGTEGVDAVSGASVTSKAIFTAVEDCLKQAAPAADDKAAKDDKAADAKDAKAEAGSLKDGSYTAEGKGIGGKVPVTVTVKDGKIAEVTVGENSETQGIGSKAIEQLPAKIVEAGGTEGVDAVSGASVTSKAIFTAVEDCLKQAK